MTGPRRSYALGTAAALLLTIAGLSPAAAAPSAVAPPAAPGAQTSGDSLYPNVGNGGYDVLHYDIALKYDHYAGSIAAKTTIDATAEQRLSSFSLDFEGLRIASVTVGGVNAPYVRVDDDAATKHKLIITPATPVDGDFTTVITYSGIPKTHIDPDESSEGWIPTDDGATVLNEPVGAMTLFPNNNTQNDKATFDITLDVPTAIDGKPAAGVSNGELVSRVDTYGNRSVWTWRQTKPMATYLSTVSIGKYTMHQDDISLAGGRTVTEYSFVDSDTSADDTADIETSRALLGPMLRYLEHKLGPYPGNSTGIIFDNTDVGYALETQDRPFFEGNVAPATLLHELTHQWFGDAVSATDWSDLWLAEGPATFFEAQYAYDTGATTQSPATVFHDQWDATTDADWSIPMAGFTDPVDLFGGQTYDRGARSLQALRTLIGDAAFDATLGAWIARRSGSSGSTADWIALAEEISGRDLTAFYQDWAYDTDKPAWPAASTPPAGPVPSTPGRTIVGRLTQHPTPRISGMPKVSRTLKARPGRWDTGTRLSYRWYIDGHRVNGGTDGSLRVPSSAKGHRIRVRVTGSKPGYGVRSELSGRTATVR